MPESLPETFGRYRILKRLGEGGMGTVYLAHDSEMDRDVALKVPQFGTREEEEVIERFKREARIASRIRHPGICPIFDVGCRDGIHYLTMAFIEGTALADLVGKGSPWSATRAIELMIAVAEAVHELHRVGIVHRDLKPDNILIQPDGRPVLLDFGLARSLGPEAETMATGSAAAGTPGYMAPEQWNARVAQIQVWTDVYALGVIFFELLTGERPFRGPGFNDLFNKVTKDPRPKPSVLRQGIAPAVDLLCADAMAVDPTHRPADMQQLIGRLQQCLKDSPTVDPAPATVPGTRPPIKRVIPETRLTGGKKPDPAQIGTRKPHATLVPASGRLTLLGIAIVSTVVFVGGIVGAWLLFLSPSATPSSSVVSTTPQQEPEKPITNSIGMKFVRIDADRFRMGSTKSDREKVEKHLREAGPPIASSKSELDAEQPQHVVEITQPFYLGVYEVTQEEYERVMGRNPSRFRKGGTHEKMVEGLDTTRFPVDNVSWHDATKFIHALNQLQEEKDQRRSYRLPTEAEWEFACRGGRLGDFFHYGDKLTYADANFETEYPFHSAEKKQCVGRTVAVDDPNYQPNAFGMHHMHGNVSEWCNDWFDESYYQSSPPQNPPGPAKPITAISPLRILRGGSWNSPAWQCRSASRFWYGADAATLTFGFRVVCVQKR